MRTPVCSGGSRKSTGYSNAQFDGLSEKAAATLDLGARKDLLYQMQRILADEVPIITYYYPDGNYAYRPAAYSGWITDPGHGILTKRSFLPGYQRPAAGTPGK